jgi:DNA recombination protein RmuC
MQTALIILVIIAVIANIVVIWAIMRKRNGKGLMGNDVADSLGVESQKLILEQINDMRRTLDEKLNANTKEMSTALHRQFSESQKLIKDITSELEQVKETGKQVISFADQLQNLQDILKNPKQRGILGEYYLETLLRNVMPPGSFAMQYEMPSKDKDGAKVIADAVVFVKDKIIPIDSKFSLENYNRLVEEKNPIERDRLEKLFKNDLKNRVDETAKYIQPENGTMDFAFMFIPHEAIYYDLLVAEVGGMKINTRDLIEYAFKDKHVLIVSPTSFLAFLQTVLQGLKALKIEETAKDIVKRVGELGNHLKSFEDYYMKMGSHLGTVVNQYNLAGKEFRKIDKDVMRITGDAPGLEVPVLDKPEGE